MIKPKAPPAFTLELCCDGRRVAVLKDGLTIHVAGSVEAARGYLSLTHPDAEHLLTLSQAVARV